MAASKYTIDEICDRGEKIYEEQIKHLVEPHENGKFIVIDIETGDYEIDGEELDAHQRLEDRRPKYVGFLARVGYKATYHLGGGWERIDH
ncbi:MAG: hypothetical protein F4X65_10145 [Chloroflexi bacterium]|nr:hypothetical protein [Chloroflexota bacterium]